MRNLSAALTASPRNSDGAVTSGQMHRARMSQGRGFGHLLDELWAEVSLASAPAQRRRTFSSAASDSDFGRCTGVSAAAQGWSQTRLDRQAVRCRDQHGQAMPRAHLGPRRAARRHPARDERTPGTMHLWRTMARLQPNRTWPASAGSGIARRPHGVVAELVHAVVVQKAARSGVDTGD